MSKKNNVNPDHYKTAGRMRPGEPGLQERQKQEYAQAQAEQAQSQDAFLPGASVAPPQKDESLLTDDEQEEENGQLPQADQR